MNAACCPLCGEPNECPLAGSATYKGPCWCMTTAIPDELRARVPEESRNQCLCPRCVAAAKTSPSDRVPGGVTRAATSLLLFLLLAVAGRAATITEDFAANPFTRGWRAFGETSLFQWDAGHQQLAVTWDSRRTNSYFLHPLGTVLGRDDDFSLAFDLRLDDLTLGIDPAKPDTFQIAIGLLNEREATATNFFRGAGTSATYGPRDLIEFDYFADSGFGATWAATMVSTNRRWAFAHTFPLELTPGDWFHIRLSHRAADRTLELSARRNDTPYGLPPENRLAPLVLAQFPGFTDFRVDAVAVCSYSDARQPEAFGPAERSIVSPRRLCAHDISLAA